MIAVVVAAVAFAAMEGVSYVAHRWVMHGPGIGWHASHHRVARGRLERNDLFPALFSLVGAGLFVAALRWPAVRPVAIGVTAYGVAYLVVHEVVIHRRLGAAVPEWRWLTWLRVRHGMHHRYGGEPYGMLLPVVPRELRERAAADDGSTAGVELDVAVDTDVDRLVRRPITRAMRNRL